MTELGPVTKVSDFNLSGESFSLDGKGLNADGEKKEINQDEAPLSDELMQASVLHALGENAIGIIHELRNPLQAIQSYLQILERNGSKVQQEPARYFDLLYGEIRRMDGLLEQFLRLARLAPAEPKPLIIAELVNEVMPLLASLAKVRAVQIETVVEVEDVACLCDEQQFKRLLFNLFVNACDASASQPEACVRVQLKVQGPELVLDVIDNGCGIPNDKLAKIWRPFYTSKPNGTGLGLPSCAQFAIDHQGSLTVSSTPGQGSTFTLCLPIMTD